ncbi:MAG: hypothetical protein KKC68_00375 [Candidatus Thermoplasmatota archaeon]|nr:hypothetical protein [Candidatus Thermoplasmatota archaeon]MBU1940207.1 hypothetical protein [Candidatus Thermoplasmatota archaeon]
MKISACPRCGSKNIFAGKMSSGILFGVTSWTEECRDCGYQGSPLLFNSMDEYVSFLTRLQKQRDQDSQQTIGDSSNVMMDDGKQSSCEGIFSDVHWHRRKWWVEIMIASILATFVSVTSTFRNVSLFGTGVGVLYSVLEFIIFFIFILIGIVIVEYILFFAFKKIKKC